jgi:hypothetical protein
MMRPSLILSVVLLALIASGKCLSDPSQGPAVSTLSGTGVTGSVDGSRLKATYMMPFGLAYDGSGRLYVSDGAAQRIRVIERDGSVRTVAGSGATIRNGLWVVGGFQNGPGQKARFNRPAGLAFGSDGALYVADTNNHCIRRIDSSGNVTTYAGTPGVIGQADGPVASATFNLPTGLSRDRKGNLYVADYSGVRVISSTGDVTTIPGLGIKPFGIATVDTATGPVIFVADVNGIVRRGTDQKLERYATREALLQGTKNLLRGEPLGYPFSLAAFDENTVVFTDVRSNAIKYLNWVAGNLQTIGGLNVLDGGASGSGFQDGTASASRFDAPLGIAIGQHNDVLIADAGNKRIRRISNLDRAHDAAPGSVIPKATDTNGYRIAFVGNSFLWNYTRWNDAIQGIVEQRLRRDYPGANIHADPYVFPGAYFDAQGSFIEWAADVSLANFIVFNVNPPSLSDIAGPYTPGVFGNVPMLEKNPAKWMPSLTASLQRMQRDLSARHIGFLVYTTPLAWNLSPTELTWEQLSLFPNGQVAPDYLFGEQVEAAVKASGVPTIDFWSIFAAEERSADHSALFGTADDHFSQHGRAIVGETIAKYFDHLRPWERH